jgi:hypothetical protein
MGEVLGHFSVQEGGACPELGCQSLLQVAEAV